MRTWCSATAVLPVLATDNSIPDWYDSNQYSPNDKDSAAASDTGSAVPTEVRVLQIYCQVALSQPDYGEAA